jgi:hypothetical protein
MSGMSWMGETTAVRGVLDRGPSEEEEGPKQANALASGAVERH